MNIETIRTYCLSKKGTTEGLPFGDQTLVIKVMEKIFALLPLDDGDRINLKCEPELAIELRERYDSVLPGFHMNKKHWNTVIFTEGIPANVVREMIDHSYDRVVAGLKKSDRIALSEL